MKITIDSSKVKIEASGLEFLKLKAEITKRLGSIQTSGKDFISFPESSLYLVEDLVNPTAEGINQIESIKEKFQLHGLARIKALEIIESNDIVEVPETWAQTLDPLQATAVSAMVLRGLFGLCLFDEQGSGKTVMTIAAFDVLMERNSIDAMIVVCPKSMMSEWPKDLQRFLPNKYSVVLAEGDRKQKNEAAYKDFDVLVTNYEGIEAMLTPLLASADLRNYLLVVDESYYLKNTESVRSEKAQKLRAKCKRCFVLCGTPAPNSAHDLVNQFDLADLGYTFGGFRKSSDPTRDWDTISQLVDERGLFIRRLKTEILENVPEKNFHVIRVQLEGKQALMYEQARLNLELELKTFSNETFRRRLVTYFQRRAVLLQICCSPDSIDPTLSETPAKFEVLDKLLQDLVSNNRKVVVWSFFKKSLDDMATRYAKYNPVRVDGSVSTSKRREAVNAFQNDPKVKLFLGNPAAAGAGITLHAAYDAVYFSYSNQAAHYLQSLDRIHRRGQLSEHVNYYLLVCRGTVEETEIIRLRGKEIRQNGLLRDHAPWPTSLDDALNELSGDA
jgi:SNF2 family DNA or RNA helicase